MTNNNYYIYILINTNSTRSIWITFFILFYGVTFGQNQKEIQLANEYLLKGEKRKALELYRELSKQENNNAFIYNNFFNTLLDLGAYDDASDYLKKISKKDPENIQYQLDLGLISVRSGDLNKADRYFKGIIEQNKNTVPRIKMMAEYFSSHSLHDYGIIALLQSRQSLNNPSLFCLDLAMLYRLKGNQDKMVQEYLTYVTQTSANVQYVKNVMQALLTAPEELASLEKILYERVQEFPDVEVYSDLLIWVTMQQKNFYASFIQARAYDKRYKHDGEKCMEVARVALDNEDYDNAVKIYSYVMREYANTSNYLLATLGLIQTQETQLKKAYPVKRDSVKILIAQYKKFISMYPDNANALEAARSQAMLFANYLDQKDTAIQILIKVIANPRTLANLKSKVKLDLGDIYLLKGEPWESSLLYSQVEKTQKDNPVGYEAKLKNAKLSYYKGDFRLAQEHLNILKEATTREIANDALDLSMRIKENIAFDSVGHALKQYALTELLLYQNKTSEALENLDKIKQGTTHDGIAYANQTIFDDVYWLEANIRMQQGEFEKALSLLKKIQDEHGEDILADDAYFLQGEIYERQLKDNEKAKEIYREFLNQYPGSVYAAEARKRYRKLRGDFTSQEQPQF